MIKYVIARFFILLIRSYRVALSPFFTASCRFSPSCSLFSTEAIEKHGLFRGGWMSLRRIARCYPLSRSAGYDPVP